MDAAVATSLFWIAVAAVLAPLIAGAVPRRLVPEVVLLLVAGVLIGPYAFDLAETGSEIGILRELGLGMLFLLAGYEIDPPSCAGGVGAARCSPGACACCWRSVPSPPWERSARCTPRLPWRSP